MMNDPRPKKEEETPLDDEFEKSSWWFFDTGASSQSFKPFEEMNIHEQSQTLTRMLVNSEENSFLDFD
jgi:hypothetical protein